VAYQGGRTSGHTLLGAGFGGAPTHFAVNKIVFLSRNLDQNMPRNGLFFRKSVKTAETLVVPPPKPQLISSGWGSATDPEWFFSYIIAISKS